MRTRLLSKRVSHLARSSGRKSQLLGQPIPDRIGLGEVIVQWSSRARSRKPIIKVRSEDHREWAAALRSVGAVWWYYFSKYKLLTYLRVYGYYNEHCVHLVHSTYEFGH